MEGERKGKRGRGGVNGVSKRRRLITFAINYY